jgi:hypothetical protein
MFLGVDPGIWSDARHRAARCASESVKTFDPLLIASNISLICRCKKKIFTDYMMLLVYPIVIATMQFALTFTYKNIDRIARIAFLVVQCIIITMFLAKLYVHFKDRVFFVDGRIVQAKSKRAAEQLSRAESIVRDTVVAATGRTLNATIAATDSGVAGVTTGKTNIRICVNGDDHEDAVAIVALHEAAHALNTTYGHDENFRAIQNNLVNTAVSLGHLTPFNEPKSVCGTTVSWPSRMV